MLSVLIPIFNYDVNHLLASLSEQGKSAGIEFEILCYDDGSAQNTKSLNAGLKQIDHVVYKELNMNIGRSRIRNRLANDAKYKVLLFMDCDMLIVKDDFLDKYIKSFEDGYVIVGGVVYDTKEPEDRSKLLRWKFGHEREALSTQGRSQRPYKSFMSGNFMIDKNVFHDIGFDENISEYGHEDTLFGKELRSRNIPIKHIQNPLLHIGLESASLFIDKTRHSIENLATLIKEKKLDSDVKLVMVFITMKRLFLTGIMQSLFDQHQEKWLNNLKSENPSLRKLDLYKLGYLIKCLKEKAI